MTEWYQEMELARGCARCGTVDDRILAGRFYCGDCAQKVLAKQTERRAYLRMQKRCIQCGGRDERTERGLTLCSGCAQKQRELPSMERFVERYKAQQKRLREERREAGVCTKCGGERDEAGFLMCTSCREKQREYLKTCGTRERD